MASVDPDRRAMKVNEIIKELIILTKPKDHSLLPTFLQSIVRILTYITQALVITAQHTNCHYASIQWCYYNVMGEMGPSLLSHFSIICNS